MSDSVSIHVFAPPAVDGQPFIRTATALHAESVEWSEDFYGGGRFTIRCHAGAQYAQKLMRRAFVLINGYYGGYIDRVERVTTGESDTVTASGFDVRGLLAYASTIPPDFEGVSGYAGFDAQRGSTETIIKHFIDANRGRNAYPVRRVPGLRVAADRGRGLPNDKYAARYMPVSEVVRELGEAAELGLVYTVDLKAGTVTFDCRVGDKRHLAFEIPRKNVRAMTLIHDDNAMSNVFYATKSGAEFADEALTMTYWADMDAGAGQPSGLWRRETHLNISVDTPVAGDEYNELKRQALTQAAQFAATQSFTAEIHPGRAIYRKHFDLGDYVTVQHRGWGVTLIAQVTGVTTRADAGGKTVTVALGRGRPSPLAIVKRDLRNGV